MKNKKVESVLLNTFFPENESKILDQLLKFMRKHNLKVKKDKSYLKATLMRNATVATAVANASIAIVVSKTTYQNNQQELNTAKVPILILDSKIDTNFMNQFYKLVKIPNQKSKEASC